MKLANPAESLNKILSEWINPANVSIYSHRDCGEGGDEASFRLHRQAIRLIDELESILSSMDRTEQRKNAQERMLTKLTKWVFAYPHNWTANPLQSFGALGDQDVLDYLESIAGLIDDRVPVYSPEQRQSILETINDVIAALSKDSSLSRDLKNHMLMLISEAQRSLQEYEVMGDFSVQAAMERLSSIVSVAAEQSSDPSKWARFRTNFVWPAAVALTAASPQLAITALAGGSAGS